jgi:hypothetical protein
MFKLHLDTDIGGDIDDLCALAIMLNWQHIELGRDDHGFRQPLCQSIDTNGKPTE